MLCKLFPACSQNQCLSSFMVRWFWGLSIFLVTIVKIIRNPMPSNFRMYYIGDGADGGEPLGDGSGDAGFCDLVGFDGGGFDGGGCDGGDG
jgi:hypothetical protein